MWKAQVGVNVDLKNNQPAEDDDWETDPDFINDVTEEQQRWGSTTVEGSGRTAGAIDMNQLRRETEEADALKKQKERDEGPNAAFGYGGKFGVQQDRMDQSAVGHDYIAKLEKHASQKDYSTGFGGKFGVQNDRVDKSAVNWDHKEKVEKHASQKDYTSGFGGKFGVQKDRQDKSAVGWDHIERIEKHESQKDYSRGFGGKFGVQSDRQDKSAVGWDHHELPQKHESQLDHKKGFGGKFGVQTDRMDKSAVAFGEEPTRVGTNYTKVKPDIGSAKPSELRAKFEHKAKDDEHVPRPAPVQRGPTSSVQARAAAFSSPTKTSDETVKPAEPERAPPRQLDQSKLAFLSQTNQPESPPPVTPPAQKLNQSKISQFSDSRSTVPAKSAATQEIREELQQLKLTQQQKQPEKQQQDEQVYGNIQETVTTTNRQSVDEEVAQFEAVEAQLVQEEEIVDTGLSAVALYDYQAAADDEISFDPDDIITHVEMIDEGWWRGMCKGLYGLFPANYVQLQ